MSGSTFWLRSLCHNCILAPINRNAEQLIPCCTECQNKWKAADEIDKLRDAIRRAGFVVCQSSGEWTLYDETEQGKVEQQRCLEVANRNVDLEIENSRLKAIIAADEARLKFLAGCGSDCGPVIEGFGNVLDDFWNFLGDAIRERIGEENDTPDEEGTDEDRLKAIRALIDEAMKNEKVVRS